MPRFVLLSIFVWSLSCAGYGADGALSAAASAPGERPPAAARSRGSRLPVQLVTRESRAVSRAGARPAGNPIPIPPPRAARGDGRKASARTPSRTNVGLVVTSSLAIVLGLFFLVVWLSRRALPKSATSLPAEVLEVMGRAPLASRHNLQLIRIGQRLLLVSVTPDNAETLTEITDADEVNHLASLCRQHQPGSISSTFRQVLQQLGTQNETRSRRGKNSPDQQPHVPTADYQRP